MVLRGQKNPAGQSVQDVLPSLAWKPLTHGSGAELFTGQLIENKKMIIKILLTPLKQASK